jgi:hypothetical protein
MAQPQGINSSTGEWGPMPESIRHYFYAPDDEALQAYARADAWARSVPGTPYGVTEVVREVKP